MRNLLYVAAVTATFFTSCSSDDDINEIEENEIIIPANYTFERDGQSTVDYNGQTTRLQMAAELNAAFTDFDNSSEQLLLDMFSNTNNAFSNEELNASDKSIKSKIASSNLYFSTNTVESNEIKADFEGFISEQMTTVLQNKEEVAEAGVAGQIASGSSVRYVNEKGLELNQAFAKGLIGGLLADQILNNYLSTAVLDEGDNRSNNDDTITEDGQVYTTMEHKWDEAYGYLVGDPSIPGNDPFSMLNQSNDRLLFSYLGQVDADEDFAGIAAETLEAFKVGRAAIVAGDYELRDEQVAIIRENLSTVIAVRAVHYLMGGKTSLAEGEFGSAFHELSEGYGFIYSLRFTNNPDNDMPYLETESINAIKSALLAGNGFWDVTPETLDSSAQEIASEFGFTVAEAAE
ncbi:DUF4856 domain-containing protein [Gramella sp. AN32]|uniref:DUF4856 domain-containing protein n=1 Tax=Christiangramia antarctica TaxID=2058158 RepID=A0ABW5X356_9FLAO|nr:DUF4856 domain-containing protein [Gramella sp. AN32]MCM4157666.1 DUF4856 domain-containing protein [Gramella sp. AN32]